MAAKKVVVAIGSTAYSNEIKQKKLTIDKLFDILSEPVIRNKKDGPYFVFASFKEDQRNAANVKYYYGATIDLDNSDILPRKIRATLKPLKSRYIIYTTHSHKAEGKGNRYRIVIPYDSPVSKDRHVEIMIYLNSLFSLDGVDYSSKTLSLPMYLPACPKKRKKHFYCFESRFSKLFDPDQKIEIPAHVRWAIEELNQKDTDKVDITEEVVEGGRNEHIARVAGTLIQQGKDLQEIIDFCDEINYLKFSPPMDDVEVARTVKSVWKSHTRNSDDKDWGYKQILARVRQTSFMEQDLDHLLEIMAVSIRKKKTSNIESEKLLKEIKAKDSNLSLALLRDELKTKQKADKADNKIKSQKLEIDEELDSPVIDKIQKQFKDYFFVASQNQLYNRKYEIFYKLEGFNNQFSSLKQDFGFTNLSPFRILDEVEAIHKVDMVSYHAGESEIFKDYKGRKCLNTYIKPTVKPYKGDIKPLLKHFEYMFPKEYERDIVLEFIAFNYQNPGVKMKWGPVIKGRKGIGKSLIASYIIAPLFGFSNVTELSNTQPLLEKFNSWQTDAQLVILHELFIDNNLTIKKKITEYIKSFVTDRFLTLRKMNTDGVQVENLTNFMAFTNHEGSLYITPDERRFCMIRCEVEKKPQAYYRKLFKYLEENMEAVAHYFKHKEIKTIDPYTLPMTDYTEEVITASLNWAEALLKDELEDPDSLFNRFKALSWEGICNIILSKIYQQGRSQNKFNDIYNASTSTGRVLRQAMIENSFKLYEFNNSQNRLRVEGKLQKVWITPYGMAKDFHLENQANVKKEASECISEAQVEFDEYIER